MIAVLIGFSVLASPLIGFLIALLFVGAIVGVFLARRSGEQAGGAAKGESASIGDRSSYRGGPAAPPRSGGAPASGEGEAGAGDAATPPLN